MAGELTEIKDPASPVPARPLRNVLRVMVMGALIIGASSWYVLNDFDGGFPVMSQGEYLGTLNFENGMEWPLYVSIDKSNMFAGVLSDELEIHMSFQPYAESQSDSGPLFLALTGLPLRVVGAQDQTGFTGLFHCTESSCGGSWKLHAVVPSNDPSPESEELSQYLVLLNDLVSIKAAVAATTDAVDRQKEEITKLSDYISEGTQLKARAENAYREALVDRERVQKELDQKNAEAKRLEEKLSLALRVTQMGKLVKLSDESLEREARWINSMYVSSPYPLQTQFKTAVERAELIRELQLDIAREQEKIEYLRSVERGPSSGSFRSSPGEAPDVLP